MKTKNDVILEVLNAQVLMLVQKDQETKKGYGDRFMKAAHIVLAGGVKALGGGKYEVKSGTQADVTYTVNGSCDCEDAKNWTRKQKGEVVRSYAPEGRCKHRLAVTFEKTKDTKLKALVDNRYPHPHTWDCDEHRGEGVTCWQMQCPDPTVLPCPHCSARKAVHEHDEHVDITTGEITTETPFPEETPEMISTIGETIIGVMSSLHGHTNGHTGEPEPVTAPLLPEQSVRSMPAPVALPTHPPMPEAPVSFYIKFKVDNFELSYTMRAHTDREVIERLPGVLAGLEDVLKIEIDHEEPFLKRLLHAFFPEAQPVHRQVVTHPRPGIRQALHLNDPRKEVNPHPGRP